MIDPSATAAVRSTAEVATARAARYMTQLCKHFAHRCPVTHDERAGRISFAMGECRLHAATGVLTLSLEAAEAPRMAQLQEVVARHLLRFAFREDMQVDWRPA